VSDAYPKMEESMKIQELSAQIAMMQQQLG
jgi:hypothetical protein